MRNWPIKDLLLVAGHKLMAETSKCPPGITSYTTCAHCSGNDALTHITAEHREAYIWLLEPCDVCGAASGQECHHDCRWAMCPDCGLQNDEHTWPNGEKNCP